VKRPLPIAVVLAAVALLALLGYGVINKGQDTTLDSAVAKGERPAAPDRTLPLVGEGATTRSLASYRGKVVVLNIWASWCIPCRDEAPVLQRTQERISSLGGTVLGVTYRDIEGRSQKFIREFHITYPSLRDAEGKLTHDYGATAVPETFVIDRKGRVVALSRGTVSQRWLDEHVNRALGQSA
jgi:cytochrome c biogenesis protein CcmG, thiol:disulfide interchange protein DsbE